MTTAASKRTQTMPIKKHSLLKRLGRQWQLMIMSVPIMLYVLLFNYVPLWGWIAAFQDYAPKLGIFGSKWVNFDNFKWLFNRPDFWDAVINSIGMSVLNLVGGTLSSILLAVLLNEVRIRAFKRVVQTVTYLPHFLSMVIVVSMAQNMFSSNGVINDLLISMGLMSEPIFWLGTPNIFWPLVCVINIWKEVGWNSIIYISTMTSIDPTLYEAASIDGAGRWQRILNVTLPGIRSTFFVLLIMNIGHLMEAGFEIQYLMENSQVLDRSRTIDVFALHYGISSGKYGYATAAGMFKSVISIALLFGANLMARKMGEDTLI